MKKGLSYSLISANFIISFFILLFAFSIFGFLWIQDKHQQFEEDVASLRLSYVEEKQNKIKSEVDDAILFIRYQEALTEERLRRELKSKINEAVSVMQGIYNKYNRTESVETVQGFMKEALREIRFFDGRGYFYLYDLEGICMMHPINPALEGTDAIFNFVDSAGNYPLRDILMLWKIQVRDLLTFIFFAPTVQSRNRKYPITKFSNLITGLSEPENMKEK